MNNLAFVASVVGSLAIPFTILVALVIFRGPLTDLLGRIISYEGLGQKVNFGQKLAGAEKSVIKAVAQAQESAERPQLGGADTEQTVVDHALSKITSTEQNPHDIDLRKAGLIELAELATSNPSFVVIKAWEELEAALMNLVKEVFPGTREVNPLSRLPDLVKERYIDDSFVNAVRELRGLRNNVAHGQHNPTAGEAVTYLESARELTQIALIDVAQLRGMRRAREQFDEIHAAEQSDRAPE